MEIFLMRHGIAEDASPRFYPNDDRPLSAKGRKQIKQSLLGISKLLRKPDIILTSPLSRAQETALLVASALRCNKRLEVSELMYPDSAANPLLKNLLQFQEAERVMLVGHEPNLTALAALLLQTREAPFLLKKGAICKLAIDNLVSPVPASIEWLLGFKQLRLMS